MAAKSSLPGFEDDERESRLLRNLHDYYSDDRDPVHDRVEPDRSVEDIHQLLEALDEPKKASKADLPTTNARMRQLIAAKLLEIEEDYRKNRASYLDAMRREARKSYAQLCAMEGRTVRRYKRHPIIPAETADERKRRLHREGSRRRAGKHGTSTREYLKLDGLSEEDRIKRKRQQDAASKRRRRAALSLQAGKKP